MDTETPSKFLSNSWNRIASTLGPSVDESGKRLQVIADEFRLPRLLEYLWIFPYWVEQWGIAKRWLEQASKEVSIVVNQVAGIIIDISEERIPMPPKLKQKVMRSDVAMEYALKSMLRGSVALLEPDIALRGAETVFGLTEPTLPVDPDADPTDRKKIELEIDRLRTKQGLWRAWLRTIFSFAIIWLPITTAYVCGVIYWRLWTDANATPSLPQDSTRVRGSEPVGQHRQNKQAGKDK